MKPQAFSLTSAFLAVMLLGACAGDSDRFPSLAIRDVERANGQFTPSPAELREPISPVASPSDIASLIERATLTHQRFMEARSETARLVDAANGQGIESNARQLALVALADLTAIRSETATTLGEIDLLAAEASTTFAPSEDLATAQAEVAALVAVEDAALDELSGELAP